MGNRAKLSRFGALKAVFCPDLAGLPTALYEKSPAQSAELQFVCGERGNHPFVAPFRILMQEAPTNGWTGDFAVFDISSNLSQNHLFQCYLLIPVHLL